MSTLPAEVQAQIKDGLRAAQEAVIRDMAANVASLATTRRDHPSYGVGKAQIRTAADRMEGAIGLYMVLMGQSAHPFISLLAKFGEADTEDRVRQARSIVASL